ncbi:DUF58 domain-containing protein [Patulibacter defluvii]|uniref:DUF58 domain-containing protein n=1 Tax=Patulibacter defluvii TaxID=3095358 RepID=UPI002A749480|nr:DUF58 domain-containing protein [Patulibacter sp. DM4]
MSRRGRRPVTRAARPWRPLALLAAGLLAFGLAGLLGSAALFAVGTATVATVVGGALLVAIGARRIAVVRTLGRDEVGEGEPLPLTLDVVRGPGPGVEVERLDGDGRWVPLAAPGAATALAIGHRGRFAVAPTLLRIRDPLGIVERRIAVGRPEQVTVLPAPGAEATRAHAGGTAGRDLEPDGLRPYVPGTPIARIHWRSLARGGELHERRLAAAPSTRPLLVVDTAAAEDEAVDWVARTTAGHLERLARDGGCRLLLPGDREPWAVAGDRAAVRDALRRLAALERSATVVRPAPGQEALWLRASRPPAGVELAPRPALPQGVVAIREPA